MRTTSNRTHHELLAALSTLRVLVKEVGGNYLSGLQSEVARVQQSVRGSQESEVPAGKRKAQMSAMLKMIQELDVKPPKGRRRDLKQLDKIISKLHDWVNNW